MIECRGVGATAGTFTIRDVSFVIPKGVHAALMGPTASGKTTLLEIIAGAIVPTCGSVILQGVDSTSRRPEARGIGFVPQHGYLFPHLSAAENVQYGATDANTVATLARTFGVEHMLQRAVARLSGGERQLVALCRALAPRPGILLLDEPFSALDGATRSKVLDQLASLQSAWGFTTLHVTHNEADAKFATICLKMADGALT